VSAAPPLAGPADHEAAAALAEGAGALLQRLRESWDGDGRELGRSGDAAANQLLMAELAHRFPDDAVLSEETVDDGRRLRARRAWIIDPLDGTREFAEPGRADWAVHVALVAAGQVIAAAVALPAQRLLLSTGRPVPASRLGAPVHRIAVSRTRPPELAGALAEALGADLVAMGSAGAKTAAVVLGAVDAYVHAGGQLQWDSAAPVGVALAAGLHASRLDGSALIYNQRDVSMPDLLVCRPEMAASLLAEIARLR
jgi:3'(2'), 5'-bisphosphate nucleotidase